MTFQTILLYMFCYIYLILKEILLILLEIRNYIKEKPNLYGI